ncbi:MAG: YitT family protein [Ruminococcaceae bacterium]|nr:YitT family protein [Oscillospiraceae bacterium]
MSRKQRSALVEWTIDIAVIVLAAAIFSVGIVCFISPNDIAPGGGTGIAIILSELTSLPLGLLIAAVNIPLIVAGFVLLNKKIMVKTLVSVAVITLMTDFVFADMPLYNADGGNGILAAVFGGVLMGAGIGLTYARGATSGGTDIIAKIVSRFYPDLKLGQIQFFSDAVIILLGLAVFRDLDAALYAVISVFVQSKLVDMLVYGGQESRLLMVFSEIPHEISKRLVEADRGVTLLQGEGAYSGTHRHVIVTAVYKSDYTKIRRMIRDTDPLAFVIVTSAGEVFGKGFQPLN